MGVQDIYRNREQLGSPLYALGRMRTWVVQPSADTYLLEQSPDTNYGTSTTLTLTPYITWRRRGLMTFNLAGLPISSITAAILRIYCTTSTGAGRNIMAYRLLRTDWVEGEATWNHYKGTTNWGTTGCFNSTTDYTTVGAGIGIVLAATNWVEWCISDQVRTAIASVGGMVHILLADNGNSAAVDHTFNTREILDLNAPQLVIYGYA